MVILDYVVIIIYFAIMVVIGFIASRRIKVQEDYFLGGRSFGKLLQTFAAFGAGTGSSDPVNTGRTTFTSGMSGMWSVMFWLFVTPFYWFTGVWYRRMRHTTLADWFVERYQSKPLGVAYVVFGLTFFMLYGSMLFSAIGKVASPLMETETIELMGSSIPIEYLLVPVIGVVVLLYGVAGGLEAAYYTDLIQGFCIILLSVMLIPFGLQALVDRFGTGDSQSMLDGFGIMHDRLPKEYFSVVGSGNSAEFPLHRIVAVVLINLIGVAVQPHFIVTGGGSAKTEWNARIGLVTGNFLKRFCTVGWVLTALIALALFADDPQLIDDPDKTWGVASRELLGPGLTGLMLACLLAALMSSVDAYMVVGSALVVRNVYVAYINPTADEKKCLQVGRWTGAVIVTGAVIISLMIMNVFKQLQLTWVLGVVFAAPFWVGMLWRRGTTIAAWASVLFCLGVFLVAPLAAPLVSPQLRTNPVYTAVNDVIRITTTREAAPSDVAKRDMEITLWKDKTEEIGKIEDPQQRQWATVKLGPTPEKLIEGSSFNEVKKSGGKGVYWSDRVVPVAVKELENQIEEKRSTDDNKAADELQHQLDELKKNDPTVTQQIVETEVIGKRKIERLRYPEGAKLVGLGSFRADFIVYRWVGLDLTRFTDAALSTMNLPVKIVAPFLIMILISLITPANHREGLNRYFIKMKTEVRPDPKEDQAALEHAYSHPEEAEAKKLFPGTSLEIRRPTKADIVGFLICFALCFGVIGLAVWVANIGAPVP
jgi:SSS family solute:Na+ symporter